MILFSFPLTLDLVEVKCANNFVNASGKIAR